jgi:HEAT repeat protein
MITLLKDEEWEMRRGGAWMLGKVGPEAEDAVPALREALDDTHPAVREKAAEALKKITKEAEIEKPNFEESGPEEEYLGE